MTAARDRRRALFMLLASAMLFGAMAFCAKLASGRLSGAEVALIRFMVGSVPFLIVPSIRRAAFTFQRLDLLIYRGLFGGLAVLCYFLAIAHIPVGVASLLNYTAPLFSGLFAAALIGETLRLRIVLPLAVAFSGLVLVIRASPEPGQHFFGFGHWELIGLTSAVLSGAAVTAIRVARRTEGSWSIYASFTLFGIVATAPFALKGWQRPTAAEWASLAAVGIFAMGAQLLMTSAYRWVDTLTAGVMSQLAVVVAMILGAVWLHDRLPLQGLIGSVLTITGVIAVIVLSSPQEESSLAGVSPGEPEIDP
jgi:drug/metabolite transporter (DMT)-like permease